MAFLIYDDIDQFQSFLGGAVNNSLEETSIEPTAFMVAKKHVIPWLSQTQWDDLIAAVAGTPTPAQTNLLDYVRRCLALLTMHEYSHVGNIFFGENGMYRMESQEMKSAYKYQENDYRNAMFLNGWEAVEWMQLFLDANSATYTLWAASDSFTNTRAYFINYAEEFRAVYTKKLTRSTFEVLRPLIDELETFAILPLIGQSLFDVLKADILAGTLSANTYRNNLVLLIRKALAHFVIEEGIKRHWIKFQHDRVVYNEQLEPQSSEKQSQASSQQISLKMRHHEEFANRHISFVKKYLTDNLDEFPEYQAYLDAQAAEESTEETDNCDERYPTCGCNYACTCSTTKKNKGVFRL